MMKKLIDAILRIFLIILFLIPGFLQPFTTVMAASKATTIKELRTELDGLKQEKTRMQNEKAMTQNEINAKNKAKDQAFQEKEDIAKKVVETEQKIKDSEVEIIRVSEETDELMRYFETSGGSNAYLNYIINSTSITDLIVRSAVVEQLTKHNEETMDTLKKLIEENKQLQIELENRNIELDGKIDSYDKTLKALGAKLYEMNELNEDIDSQIKNQNELIKYYVGICKSETQKLSECVSIIASTGWIRPLVQGKITSPWGYRIDPLTGKSSSFHNAIDIGGNAEGTPVYAPANGMVVAITVRSSCGGNIVYIHHNINGVAYTSQSAHMLSYNVKVGDKVTVDTKIGTVGGGAQTKSYDKCSTGAHLHFGISKGHYLGGGSAGYSSWSTFLAKSVAPPGYTNKIGYSWTKRV